MHTVCVWCHRRKDAGLFFGVFEAPRIDFFLKLVAASECDDEEKRLLSSGFRS